MGIEDLSTDLDQPPPEYSAVQCVQRSKAGLRRAGPRFRQGFQRPGMTAQLAAGWPGFHSPGANLGDTGTVIVIPRRGFCFRWIAAGAKIAGGCCRVWPADIAASLRPEGRATCSWPPPVPHGPAGYCPRESAIVRPRPDRLSLSLSLRLRPRSPAAGRPIFRRMCGSIRVHRRPPDQARRRSRTSRRPRLTARIHTCC